MMAAAPRYWTSAEFDPGRALQKHAGDVPERTVAREAAVDLVRVRSRVIDELLERRKRRIRARGDQNRRLADKRDRREVPFRIVLHVVVHQLVGSRLSGRCEQQRVTVLWRARDGGRSDVAACARAVVDHEGLAKRFTQILRKAARQDVRCGARRERDNHCHGARRP